VFYIFVELLVHYPVFI